MSTSKEQSAQTQKAKDARAVAQAISNVDRRKASIAKGSSNPFLATLTLSSGGIDKNLRLTVAGDLATIAQLMIDVGINARQVKLMMTYLGHTKGTAIVDELNKYAVTAVGQEVWGKNEIDLYCQTPQKVLATYLPFMTGEKAWGGKNNIGKVKLVTVS